MTAGKTVRRPAARNSAPRPAKRATSGASGYGKALFEIIERRLKSPSKRGAYIPPEQIARALRENPGIPLPPEIHDYLCNFLEGKIPSPSVSNTRISIALPSITTLVLAYIALPRTCPRA